MSAWDLYESRIGARGGTKRNAAFLRETRALLTKTKDSLSYKRVAIDGVERDVSIVDTDIPGEKTMLSLPGEDFVCGGLVEWADSRWMIIRRDANNEVYTRARLLQCNYLLRWVDTAGVLREQWCFVDDGTRYLTGEYEDRHFVVTRGDSRLAMIIGRNEHTAEFTRESRFIIDDPLSPQKLAFSLSKPLKVGKTYDGHGVFYFVLQESVTTDDDNVALGIADYYKYFPPDGGTQPTGAQSTPGDAVGDGGRRLWL